MLGRRAESHGDQQRAEFVSVQSAGMRLAIKAPPPHVGCRGMVQQAFLDGVAVEPGDGAKPPGDGGAGTAAGFQIVGEALDVGAPYLEQEQVMLVAPACLLAQVQFVGLAGQAAVAGQEPC